MAKQASGQPLTPAEQQTIDYYKQPSLDQMLLGGMSRVTQPGFPPSPQARPRVMTPPRAPARQAYSRSATNPNTGARMGLTTQGQWRTDERREGKVCVSRVRVGWWRYN